MARPNVLLIVSDEERRNGWLDGKVDLPAHRRSLRQLMGDERAKYLCLTGERFTGLQAYDWGLVTEVADDPAVRALEIAGTTLRGTRRFCGGSDMTDGAT